MSSSKKYGDRIDSQKPRTSRTDFHSSSKVGVLSSHEKKMKSRRESRDEDLFRSGAHISLTHRSAAALDREIFYSKSLGSHTRNGNWLYSRRTCTATSKSLRTQALPGNELNRRRIRKKANWCSVMVFHSNVES